MSARPPKVLDASALLAMAYDEGQAEDVARRLNGAELHAPALLHFELASAASKKVRRRGLDPDAAIEGLAWALALRVKLHPVDHTEVAVLALATGLTTYDASYLWLARSLSAALVTLDGRLDDVAQTIEV